MTVVEHGTRKGYRSGCPCADCRGYNARQAKAWRARNREAARAYDRQHRLETRYGVTVEQYESKLAEQGGVCAICGGPPQQRRGMRRFGLDHNHATGKPRGVLCSKCNSALGFLDDDPDRLAAALDYLRKYQ